MNQTANVSCYVIGVRPKNKLKWNVNNIENITDINYSVEDSVDQGTFNIHSSFQFQPPTVSGTLTCARTTTDSALQESIKVRFSAYGMFLLFHSRHFFSFYFSFFKESLALIYYLLCFGKSENVVQSSCNVKRGPL